MERNDSFAQLVHNTYFTNTAECSSCIHERVKVLGSLGFELITLSTDTPGLKRGHACGFLPPHFFLQTVTEKHKINVPETMNEVLDMSDDEGKLYAMHTIQ